MYRRSSSTPILPVTAEFFATATTGCSEQYYQNQHWYYGTGVRHAEHPERRTIPQEELYCDKCQSRDVLIVAWQRSVAYHSGDVYFDGEVHCERCQAFTTFSYAEN